MSDELILRISCAAALILNAITLAFAINNACRHLFKRRITMALIVVFYLCIFINTLANISVLMMCIISPETALQEVKIEGKVQNQLIILTATMNIGLFICLALTMFQLSLAIQKAVKEITP